MTNQPDLFSGGDDGNNVYKKQPRAPLYYEDIHTPYQSVLGVACVAPIDINPDVVTLVVRRDPETGLLLDVPLAIHVDRDNWTKIGQGVEAKLALTQGAAYCELEVTIAQGV